MALAALRGSSLQPKLYLPGSDKYNECVSSYWSLQEAELRPSAVLQPQNAHDVALSVRVLSDANVSSNYNAPFAIRSGGHQAYPGSANINDGVTIDLSLLTDITLGQGVVKVGAGNRFEDVYKTLQPHGLVIPGGRVAQVGVSGFVLGGGISWYSSQIGFVCDNVVEFEIVVADGEILKANLENHSDLFQALKGGGNNFGIVVSITMKTMPATDLYGGLIINEPGIYPQSCQLLYERMQSPDPHAAIMIGLAQIKGFRMAYHSLKYTKSGPAFEDFIALPSMQNTLRKASLLDLAVEEGKYSLGGSRRLYMTCSFRPNLQMMFDCERIWQETMDTVKDLPGLEWSVILNPIQESTVQAGAAQGGNALGLNESIIIVLLVGTWERKEHDEAGEAAGRTFIDAICSRAKDLGCDHSYIYMNYAWEGQRVIDGYGQKSKSLLQAVSKKYDPNMVFQKAVPGGFKLFDGIRMA